MFEAPHVSANYFDIKRSRIFSLSTRKGATSRTSASTTKASVFGQVVTMLGDYVVNIGDLLARWSNDRFESTAHRVLGSGGRARYSVGLFLDPNWDATVRPVTDDGEAAKYGVVRCAEYIMDCLLYTSPSPRD